MEQLILDQLVKMSEQFGEFKNEMKTEFKNVRQEMQEEFKNVRQEMQKEFKNVRQEMQEEFKNVRQEMQEGFKKLTERMDKQDARMDRIEATLKENLEDISMMFQDTFKVSEQEHEKIKRMIK